MKKLLANLLAPTPAKGKRVASWGAGIGIAGVGAHIGMQFFQPELIELLPQNQLLAYVLVTKTLDALPIILEGLGGLLFLYGQSQTIKETEK